MRVGEVESLAGAAALLRPSPAGPTAREQLPFVTVVVPVYNEAALVTASLTALVDHVGSLRELYRVELVVVDDGSTDGSGGLIDDFAGTHGDVRVIHHGRNSKLGGALRSGIAASHGDVVITYDCDLSYAPDHIDRLLEACLRTGAHVVIASPYMAGGQTKEIPRLLEVRSRLANQWLGLTAQDDLKTVTGLVRAYDGPFIRAMDLKAVDVDINVEIIYKAQLLRARIVEVPATLDWSALRERQARSGFLGERSRWNTYTSLVAGFIFRPFLFFLLPGLALGVLGVVLLVTASGQEVTRATLLGGLALLLGVQLLWGALSTLQAKRYFEELFHLGSTSLTRLRAAEEQAHRERPRPSRH